MGGIATAVAGWVVVIVAGVAFMSGPQAAASVAGTTMSVVGTTVGAIFGGADDLMAGFKAGKGGDSAQPNSRKGGAGNGANGAGVAGAGAR